MKSAPCLCLFGVLVLLVVTDKRTDAAEGRSKRSIGGLQRLIQSLPINGGGKRFDYPQLSSAGNQEEDLEETPEYREKRYFCRRFFIYNPVNGRCIPTLKAFRGKGKRPQHRVWNELGQGR